MKKIKVLLSLLVILLGMSASQKASALPAWCFRYTATDTFDSPSTWSPWINTLTDATMTVGSVSGARTGWNAAQFSFGWHEDVNSFVIIDKVFNSALNMNPALSYRYPSRGCLDHIPYFPSGTLKFCSIDVWIKPSLGASGVIQLMDPNYYYLGQQAFNFSPSSIWQNVTILNDLSCQPTMIVRIKLDKTSSLSTKMVADDVTIQWYY